MHYLLHIGETCRCTDLLEGVLYLVSPFHLLFHLLLKELAPHLLNHVVLLHFQLIRVLVLVCRSLRDLLLSRHPVHSPLKGLFLVLDGLVE